MAIDSYDTPDAEALLRDGAERLTRKARQHAELLTNFLGGGAFIAASAALAALAPWNRHLSPAVLLLVLATWVLIERVKFPVAGAWTYPTMLVFVPALFLLPTALVPAVAAAAALLQRGSDLLRGRVSPWMVPGLVMDVWFAMGPALLLVLTGTHGFSWGDWPIYLGAFAAQILFDVLSTGTWSWLGERHDPRVQFPLLAWVWVSDLTLAPLGLVLAAVSVHRPELLLIALAPTANLWLFARERRERMDETLALSTAYRGTALLLGDIVEADDHYTGQHSRDVVELSIAVARALGLDAAHRRAVEFAALLHDVGKIRIPKEVINKAGPLDDEEWQLIRRHTVDGEEMLQLVGGKLAEAGRIVRATHERFDGSGYPDGLAGAEIPLEARIISAADAFCAMTTDRSYRAAMSPQAALSELRQCAGSQFDPQVVEAIERLVAEEQTTGAKSAAEGAASAPVSTQPSSFEPSGIFSGSLASS